MSHRNSGINASDRRVSCTDRINIAISVLMIVTTLASTLEAVSVTTFWTPPTSLASRDWISPVRVVVKNRRGMNCRWAYRELRRSCITRRPTRLAMYVWPMPMMLVMIGTAIIRPTYRYSSGRLGQAAPEQLPGGSPNSASLKTLAIRSGLTTPNPEVMTMASATTATLPRYGLKMATTRRTVLRSIGR